jgi:hypothetical protein
MKSGNEALPRTGLRDSEESHLASLPPGEGGVQVISWSSAPDLPCGGFSLFAFAFRRSELGPGLTWHLATWGSILSIPE